LSHQAPSSPCPTGPALCPPWRTGAQPPSSLPAPPRQHSGAQPPSSLLALPCHVGAPSHPADASVPILPAGASTSSHCRLTRPPPVFTAGTRLPTRGPLRHAWKSWCGAGRSHPFWLRQGRKALESGISGAPEPESRSSTPFGRASRGAGVGATFGALPKGLLDLGQSEKKSIPQLSFIDVISVSTPNCKTNYSLRIEIFVVLTFLHNFNHSYFSKN
jgi:hypothetical protein